jgi:hypothetical protein
MPGLNYSLLLIMLSILSALLGFAMGLFSTACFALSDGRNIGFLAGALCSWLFVSYNDH